MMNLPIVDIDDKDIVIGMTSHPICEHASIDDLPEEIMFFIMEFIYPYILNKRHIFALVCKKWNTMLEKFMRSSYTYLSVEWKHISTESKVDVFKALMEQVLQFQSRSFTNCAIVWRAKCLNHHLCTERSPHNKSEFLYQYAQSLLRKVVDDTRLEKGTSWSRQLSEQLSKQFFIISYVFHYLDVYFVRYHNLPTISSSAETLYSDVFGTSQNNEENVDEMEEWTYRTTVDTLCCGRGISNFIVESEQNSTTTPIRHPLVQHSAVLQGINRISKLVGEYTGQNLDLSDAIGSQDDFTHALRFYEHMVIEPMGEIAKPLVSNRLEDVVPTWYATFIEDLSQDSLFEIILFTNMFELRDLSDLTGASVASMIRGKTPEEIRNTFHIKNDFTPEEENTVREENRWAEDA